MSIEIIYFVHGTTFNNAKSKCSGWKHVELNNLEKEQAVNLGKNNKYKFDVIFTSDLIRAIDSANLAWPEFDKIKDQTFYRCLGGGIEFLETSQKALKREYKEELGIDIKVDIDEFKNNNKILYPEKIFKYL